MKKVLLSLFIAVAVIMPANAAAYKSTNRVETVGATLLTKNGIPNSNVKFMVVAGNPDNSNYATKKIVNVSTDDLKFAGNDNEVAAIVANELGHIISGHASKGKLVNMLGADSSSNETASTLAANYTSSKEEKEADIIAANMMVTAGYNPLAIIVVLTKQTGTYWETIQGKPANADRAMNVFNYISYAYPAKVKAGYGCNEYKNFLVYANSVIDSRKQNKKLETKNTKTQQKAQKTSTSQLTKFKTRGGISGWDAAYELLNGAQ